MDYLFPAFHEFLKDENNCYVENGRIYIGENHWAPDDVLKMISEDTYDEAFKQWLEIRKEDLIQIADDFLDEFDQRERFNKLKQNVNNDAVVPFVGAGMSEPSGYLMWTPFLKKLVDHTDITLEQLEEKLGKGEYEEVAQDFADSLGPAFAEELENSYGVKKDIKGAVQLLPTLFNSPVITTNYDSVLKRCFDEQTMHFDEVIPGCHAEEVTKYLASGDRVLVKLHGTAMSGVGRVLTLEEYEKNYEENDVISTVISAFCTKTLLFLGCSLSVDRTLKVMRDYAHQVGHDKSPRHYAFLQAPATQELRNEKRKFLSEANIFPIWYSGGDHDQAVEALLQKLGVQDDY